MRRLNSFLAAAVLLGLANNTVIAADIPVLKDNAGYRLNEASESGSYQITIYDLKNDILTAKKYNIELKNTTYSSSDGVKYFEWSDDALNKTFGEVTSPTEGKTTITVHYDTTTAATTNTDRVDNNSNTASVLRDFIGLENGSPGAAVNNNTNGIIGSLSGNFVENHVTWEPIGAAVYNAENAEITSISGNFIANYIGGDSTRAVDAQGAAIYNKGSIGNIVSDFIGNSIKRTGSGGTLNNTTDYGGALFNDASGTINSLKGSFIGNYVDGKGAYGGALSNNGSITSIESDFIGNWVNTTRNESGGGALYNGTSANIDDLKGDFIGNYVTGTSSIADISGGAIYNKGTITNIESSFMQNKVLANGDNHDRKGGAIFNSEEGNIHSINGDFYENYISSMRARGGAIDNKGTIGEINSNFYKNYIEANAFVSSGGAINNEENAVITSINGNFAGNYIHNDHDDHVLDPYGGAINNKGQIDNIKGDFVNNYILLENATNSHLEVKGGAINNDTNGQMGSIEGNFIGNTVTTLKKGNGGAINNDGSIDSITGDFLNNRVEGETARGGAISNQGTIETIKNSSFYNNYASSSGGAIYTSNDLEILADNANTVFSGNKTSDKNEAIYVDNQKTLTLKAQNGGSILLNDSISGAYDDASSKGYNLNLSGDGKIEIYNNIENAQISNSNSNVVVSDAKYLNNNNSFQMSSGNLNILNMGMNDLHFRELELSDGKVNIGNVGVDLRNKQMGKISTDNFVVNSNNGVVNVENFNFLSDSQADYTAVLFGDKNMNVTTSVKSTMTPIYKYNISYSNDGTYGENGYFIFAHPSTGRKYENYNPSVAVSSVASQLGGYLTQLNSYNEAFRNMDMYMLMTKSQRNALKYQNKYAAADSNLVFDPLNTPYSQSAGWARPYATFERVKLKNGPDVSNVSYGSFFGFDSEMVELNDKWDAMASFYAGYNGSHQAYEGNSIYQNGGTLGLTGMFYRGNYFAGITANAGANVGEADTMYGNENFAMLMSGVALKTGYNYELADGRFIIQPNGLIGYSFVNTFNYTNAAGVNINTKPLNAITLMPGVKFIGNLPHNWQPYLGVNMVFNILDKTDFKANDIALSEMSVKPYVMYGVGLRKIFKERNIGFVQSYITNGGRDGVGLQAGLRLAI